MGLFCKWKYIGRALLPIYFYSWKWYSTPASHFVLVRRKEREREKKASFRKKKAFLPFSISLKRKDEREKVRARKREREREKETERERERERPDRESSWLLSREFLSGIIWVTWNLWLFTGFLILICHPIVTCNLPPQRDMGWLRSVESINDRSLLQNSVSFIGLFGKKDLWFNPFYWPKPHSAEEREKERES